MIVHPPIPLRKRQRGVALIIVLALLVLIAGLIVGFMRRMGTERTSAAAYYDASQNALLADYAVNLVQAQIGSATSQKLAWASQPGMVRTYEKDGGLSQAYKLYSDQAMITDSVTSADALTAMADWKDSPAHFVDLNAPIFRNPEATNIMDKEPVYPILDPHGIGKIEGFEITNAPDATTDQPAPMPVRWLYILEDGTTVAPTGTNGEVATIPGASATNPIVGRVAFWTDDESAKNNINTAGAGGFWDIPRAFGLEERDRMARFQPTLREFQRYPGHPATTSLWPALGYLFSNEAEFEDFLYGVEDASLPGLSPRLRKGGSLSGSRTALTPITMLNPGPRLYTSVDELLFNPLRADQSPLTRADLETAKFFLTARSSAPEVNLFNLPRMAIWPVNNAEIDANGARNPSVLDELIAFASTVNGAQYYFERGASLSSTADFTTSNANLYNYITRLLKQPFPGFGDTSFGDKYTSAEVDQITTQIFDYIRSSNLYSTALGANAYSGTTPASSPLTSGSSVGQVVPLKIGDTKGIGRIPVLSKAVLHFYIDGLVSSRSGVGAINGSNLPSAQVPNFTAPMTAGTYKLVKDLIDGTATPESVTPTIRAVVYFDTFDPMYGYIFPRYNFEVDVEFTGTWTANGSTLSFPAQSTLTINRDHLGNIYDARSHTLRSVWMGRYLGGNLGPLWMMQNYSFLRGHQTNPLISNGGYPLVSNSVTVHSPIPIEDAAAGSASPIYALPEPAPVETLNFSGGKVTAKIRVGSETIQTYEFDFPAFSKRAPTYPTRNHLKRTASEAGIQAEIDSVLKQLAVGMDFRNRLNQQTQLTRLNTTAYDYVDTSLAPDFDTVVSLEPAYGDKRLLATRSHLTSGSSPGPGVSFVPHANYNDASDAGAVAADLRTDAFGTMKYNRAIRPGVGFKPGRILDIPYGVNAMPDIPRQYAQGVFTAGSSGTVAAGNFTPDFDNGTLHMPDDAYVNRADEGSAYDLIATGGGVSGNRSFAWYWDDPSRINTATGAHYFNSPTFYSPNKQMSSAGMFGSLPTGSVRNHPWQTLLFRPDPGDHPGAVAGMPPDHLLLDLFWMPVVEPYAISEPFSTSGKVNMNYQIMPFSYIHRSTALQGVLHSQEIVTIRDQDAYRGTVNTATGYATPGTGTGSKSDEYKIYSEGSAGDISNINYRSRLNLSATDGTLVSFENRFNENRLFISETEICSLPLIPLGESWSANFESTYWGSRRLTGDNSREMPYTQLLPRLTTRSNTYTVHFWVQTLRKPKTATQNEWDEKKDRVISELRGSRTIERYIDPAQNDIPNYAAATDPLAETSLEAFYRWRTLSNKEFRP